MKKEHDYKLLDHGYIKLIETWGSDERIIESARMSTNKGFLGWGPKPDGKPGDEKLLKYLWDSAHFSPFEMSGMIIEVQAPIFVFREWVRHRVFSLNELSARYTPLPDVNYVPTVERLLLRESASKQAGTVSGALELTAETAEEYRQELILHYEQDQKFYERALAMGVTKELARNHLPVGRYSKMRISANLRNWFGFTKLRSEIDAQWEIRQYSDKIIDIIACEFEQTAKVAGIERNI